MITLKDYIGKIYKEVTNAKVQSDIETLAIAQEYVENPLLKHFSVPNIRIKDMELTIPVAIDTTQTVTRAYTESEIQNVYVEAFYTVNRQFFPDPKEDQLAQLESIRPEVVLKAQQQAKGDVVDLRQLSAASGNATDSASPVSEEYANTLNRAAEKFADTAYAFVSEDRIKPDEFRAAMIPEIESNLQPRSPEIEELPVIVETQLLKDINDPASLINIKVNITDDAMEWTTDVDENGNAIQVLTYE